MTKRPEIDGLRGTACLIVLVFHALAQHLPQHWSGATVYLAGTARMGVWLFFVLSAFLLTLRLLDGESLREYAVARFLRIIPLFVLAVFVYYALGLIGLTDFGEVISALTFQKFYTHLWTVPVEFEFYFLLPPLIGALVFLKSAGRAIALLLTLIVGITLFTQPWNDPDNLSLLRCLPCFGWGVMLAIIVKRYPAPSASLATVIGLGSLALLVALPVGLKLFHSNPRDVISGNYVVWSFLWAAFTFAVYSAPTVLSKIFSFRPLAGFGLTIYSTYLFHWLFMDRAFMAPVEKYIGPLVMPLSIALAIIVGAVGYHFAERPLYRLRYKLTQGGRQQPAYRS
jgi:peptidoglycan/LPS O-acetylase OafA/YrhL